MKFLILACSLVFASGCLTKPTLGGKAGTSKLNTNNLVKNPSTGIYTVKSSQQQNPTVRADAATRNFNSTNSPAEPLSKGGILPPKGRVESRNIATSNRKRKLPRYSPKYKRRRKEWED